MAATNPHSNTPSTKIQIVTIGATAYQKFAVSGTYFLKNLSTGADHQFPSLGKLWGFVCVERALSEVKGAA